ncbi:MAG: flavin reductase family protein [Saprospiraceae bacterium]|nr:flavin reductase family protein [Saprospiraceae bacterium]
MDKTNMIQIDPSGKTAGEMHQLLVGTVAPRPIALVSTKGENGQINLAPYSFFNVFSSKPPILVFSAALRGTDSTAKDTLINVRKTREVVINVVTHNMVNQMAITSIQYPPDVSEFTKAGFTSIPSQIVKPPRVAESPVHFECTVLDIIPMGDDGGAGNLVICQAQVIHIANSVLDDQERVDPHKIDLMGRMGRAFYTRASGGSIHKIYQPTTTLGIGFDQLPPSALHSTILSGNDLGRLAGIPDLPPQEDVRQLTTLAAIQTILHSDYPIRSLHEKAKTYISNGQVEEAAKLIWLADTLPS